MPAIIIANRLTDGLVVFFAEPGQWVESVADARVIADGDDSDGALALARGDETACLVVDPNVIPVEIVNGAPRPKEIREAIRAYGPSPAARTDALLKSQE